MEMGFLDLDILMALHLSGWKAIPHFFSQAASLFRSSCSMSQSCWDLICLYKIRSSAKSRVLDWTQSGRSLINSRNNNGPRTVPWGTPLMTDMLSDVAHSTRTC